MMFGEQRLNYQALHAKSRDLALHLQFLGVEPNSVVGVCADRSLEMMVGIMGTLQAGGAYLPVDPAGSDDRLAYILQDSRAAIVLTQQKLKYRLRSLLAPDAALITLDEQWPELAKNVTSLTAKGVKLRDEAGPHNASYVVYASGSPGKPNGVVVEHKAVLNRIHWLQKRYKLGRSDVVLQQTPYSCDGAVLELLWPMMAGAAVVLVAPDRHEDLRYLERLINNTRVTTVQFSPSMLQRFLEVAASACDCVARVFCGREPLERETVARYRTTFPHASLHQLYGPADAAIDATAFDCSKLDHPFVPIGSPIDNTQIYILDLHNNPQPIGVPGELHVAGDGLARGYLNRPKLTHEKFVPNPFIPGTRMYKSGDRARWLDDGNIQYLGRSGRAG